MKLIFIGHTVRLIFIGNTVRLIFIGHTVRLIFIDHTVRLIFIGHTVRLFGQKKHKGKKSGGASLNLPKVRKNPLIEIIAINTGSVNY